MRVHMRKALENIEPAVDVLHALCPSDISQRIPEVHAEMMGIVVARKVEDVEAVLLFASILELNTGLPQCLRQNSYSSECAVSYTIKALYLVIEAAQENEPDYAEEKAERVEALCNKALASSCRGSAKQEDGRG